MNILLAEERIVEENSNRIRQPYDNHHTGIRNYCFNDPEVIKNKYWLKTMSDDAEGLKLGLGQARRPLSGIDQARRPF